MIGGLIEWWGKLKKREKAGPEMQIERVLGKIFEKNKKKKKGRRIEQWRKLGKNRGNLSSQNRKSELFDENMD